MKFTNVKQLIIKFMGGGLINFPTRFLRWVKITGDTEDDGGGDGGGDGDSDKGMKLFPIFEPAEVVFWVDSTDPNRPFTLREDGIVELNQEPILPENIEQYINDKIEEFSNPEYEGDKYLNIYPVFAYDEKLDPTIPKTIPYRNGATSINLNWDIYGSKDNYELDGGNIYGNYWKLEYNNEMYILAYPGFD